MASLGGETIVRTVNSINSGTVIPEEIIVVIPSNYAHAIPRDSINNVRYEIVDLQGQVAQRLYGFNIARNKFVMQVDDDMCFEKDCIENLLKIINHLGPKSAVGPSLFFSDDKTTAYPMISTGINNLKALLLSGAKWGDKRMGTFNKIGTAYGYDPSKVTGDYVRTEWLAGGCVVHYRSGLVMENYFPFSGKAYGEDLIHSTLLSKAGVKLYTVKNAVCYFERPNIEREHYSVYSDYRSRCHLNRLRGLGTLRVHIWFMARITVRYLQRILNCWR